MKRERRIRLRFHSRFRILKSLADMRAHRDIVSICRLFAGDRA